MALDERHPDAERLAEYADDVLDAEARAVVERHLADCTECRAVVMETMAFLHSPASTTNVAASRVVPFRARRWVTGVAVGLAAAAALVLAIRVARPEWVGGLFGSRGDRPELQELIAAVANEPTRLVEGRLSGGFKYGPPPSPTRGSGDRGVSPDVRIAVANLEKIASQQDSARHRAALGDAYIAMGEFDRAIEALLAATKLEPKNALFHSDLAAAYLAQGRRLGQVQFAESALASADVALTLVPTLQEARFNRALALTAAGRAKEAALAWDAYRELDGTSDWMREAGRYR
jgi:tetratricopeptide (TPR) repeat protein